MPLTGTDRSVDTLEGQNRLANDQSGKPVTVKATTEAIQDHGWPKIWEAASRKYDKGDVDLTGKQPIVVITTKDF